MHLRLYSFVRSTLRRLAFEFLAGVFDSFLDILKFLAPTALLFTSSSPGSPVAPVLGGSVARIDRSRRTVRDDVRLRHDLGGGVHASFMGEPHYR